MSQIGRDEVTETLKLLDAGFESVGFVFVGINGGAVCVGWKRIC